MSFTTVKLRLDNKILEEAKAFATINEKRTEDFLNQAIANYFYFLKARADGKEILIRDGNYISKIIKL